MNRNDKIFVAGHQGLVGSAFVRHLTALGYTRLITRTSRELDLREQPAVREFFASERPNFVILAAAQVGGILANSAYPADFIRDNLLIQTHVIDAARLSGTRKLLFLGSSCIYPRLAPQPIHEESLLTGPLEETNQWYAIAKIAGIKMIQAYRRQYGFCGICVMPTNLYGPGDNMDLQTSHVLPALMRKFHEAKTQRLPQVIVWGTGTPRREFLHVDDLADAGVFLLTHYDDEQVVNVGTGVDLTITELAERLRQVIGYEGEIAYDSSKPDGVPQKVLDVSRLATLGWRPKISLDVGLRTAYRWYVDHAEPPTSGRA